MAISQLPNLVSYFSGHTVPVIGSTYGLAFALGIGAITNFASFIAALLVVAVDNHAKIHD
jgi:hypothetical protein